MYNHEQCFLIRSFFWNNKSNDGLCKRNNRKVYRGEEVILLNK